MSWLNAASIGSGAIARAVQERLSACELGDLPAYLERLRGSGTELQALIEAVVVPETWFFRDRHAFTALSRAWAEFDSAKRSLGDDGQPQSAFHAFGVCGLWMRWFRG